MGNYCSSGQNKKDDDSLSQKSEEYVLKRISGREPVDIIFFFFIWSSYFCTSSPTYQLASKNKNKNNKNSNTLKEAPLVDPEPTSDISNFNAPNIAGHGTKNGNLTVATDAAKAGVKHLQSVQSTHGDFISIILQLNAIINYSIFIKIDSTSGSPLAAEAPCDLTTDESLNQQILPDNLTSIYGKPTQNRRTENDRKIVLYILAADENHKDEKNILNSLYSELEQYTLSRGFELQLSDLHENCDDFLDPNKWVDEPLEARGGHHLAAMCLSEISSKFIQMRQTKNPTVNTK